MADLGRICAEALRRHRLRAALSALGIVFGVAAVVAMLAVIEGARRESLDQLDALGLRNILVRKGGVTVADPPSSGPIALDVKRVRALVPGVAQVSAVVVASANAAGPNATEQVLVVGAESTYAAITGITAARGRYLTPLDDARGGNACVLGPALGRRLFGPRDPIGQVIRLGGTPLQVVGVLAERGRAPRAIGTVVPRDSDQLVIVPLSGGALGGHREDDRREVDEVWLHVDTDARVEDVAGAVRRLFGSTAAGTHEVIVPQELLRERARAERTFSIVVGSVAVISLLVGGIGIMNIMLASVLERTPEIGLRRTVGATRAAIGAQFLAESLAICVAGGLAGLVGGIVSAWGIGRYAGWATHVSAGIVLLALTVAIGVGVAFGSYPAMRASRLTPIDAVRHE